MKMRAVVFLCLIALAIAGNDWMEVQRAHKTDMINVRFALKQKNLDVLEVCPVSCYCGEGEVVG